jgi:septum formation inhibitor MinC
MSSSAAVVPATPLEIRIDRSVPVLVIPEELDLETLRAWVRDRLPEHSATIGGRASRLDFGGRDINLFDLRRLVHLLRQEFSIDITGLYVRPEAIHRYAERELKLKLFPVALAPERAPASEPTEPPLEADVELGETDLSEAETEEFVDGEPVVGDDAAPNVEPVLEDDSDVPEPRTLGRVRIPHDLQPEDVAPPTPPSVAIPVRAEEGGRRSQTVRRTLRSGASVRFDGDLYIFGDVNPGAHVVATGNIVVLGTLKGMAHAGAAGAEDAFILAFDLRPTQVRIARKIAIPPERDSQSGFVPEIATVRDEQIVIEPYRGRIPR